MQKLFYSWCSLLVLFLPLTAFAQADPIYSEDRTSFFGLKFGSFFQHKSMYSDDFSSPRVYGGMALGAEGAWLFHRHLGIAGSIQYLDANVDGPNSFSGDLVFIDTNLWRTFSAGVGPYLSYPYKGINFEVKCLVSYSGTRAFTKTHFIKLKPEEKREIQYSHNAVGLQPGITFRLDMKPGMSMALSYEHFMTFSSYKEIYSNESNPAVSAQSESKVLYQMPMISLTLLYSIVHFKEVR